MSDVILQSQWSLKVFHKAAVEISVLRSVDIEISRGEDISIVGQSGSGKSTLLQAARFVPWINRRQESFTSQIEPV